MTFEQEQAIQQLLALAQDSDRKYNHDKGWLTGYTDAVNEITKALLEINHNNTDHKDTMFIPWQYEMMFRGADKLITRIKDDGSFTRLGKYDGTWVQGFPADVTEDDKHHIVTFMAQQIVDGKPDDDLLEKIKHQLVLLTDQPEEHWPLAKRMLIAMSHVDMLDPDYAETLYPIMLKN